MTGNNVNYSGGSGIFGMRKKPGGFLVVDDVAINIYVVQEMLRQYNLPVDTAESGREVIGKVKAGNEYDIIFMDYMMPGMSGAEATETIRSMGYTGYIVALTAKEPGELDTDRSGGGFDRFIFKPIDAGVLQGLVMEFIGDKIKTDAGSTGTGFTGAGNADAGTGFTNAGSIGAGSAEAGSTDGWSAEAGSTDAGDFDMADMEEYFIMDAEYAISTLDEMFAMRALNAGSAAGAGAGAGGVPDFTDEDIDTYEITVHGMKSALRNINRDELSQAAYQLELAAQNRDYAYIDRETPVFMEKLKDLMESLKG